MSDIELVIRIPEELKNKIDNANEHNRRTYMWWFETTLYYAIKNGTPLPKELEVLDKIRAEMELHRRKTESIDPYDLVGDCLDIIDKYKKESEEDRCR